MTKWENRLYIIFLWFMGIGAILLLALFIYHTIGYFQSPNYEFGEYMGTVWDDIVRSNLFPFALIFRLIISWFNWTFVFWYTNNILEMHLGLMTIPFWGFWIWIGITWWRGIGCI